MLNVQLSYNRTSYWGVIFWSGGRPRQFINLKKFRALVISGGGWRKGKNIQGIMTPMGVLPNRHQYLRRKGGVMEASVHVLRQSNSPYGQIFRRKIYRNRRPEQNHSPILWYEQRPQWPSSWTRYRGLHCTNTKYPSCYFKRCWTCHCFLYGID